MILEFEYLNKDDVGTWVRANSKTGEVEVKDFTEKRHNQFFAKRPHTIEYLNEKLEERCFPRTQDGAGETLKRIGLTQYNPLDIVRITHGRLWKDHFWIRFKGEDLKWEDVAHCFD